MSEPQDNTDLRELYEADQAERSGGLIPATTDWRGIAERDQARRERAMTLIDDGALQTGADHFHAAMLFQHGAALVDYWRAHELAKRADELGDRRGRWLAAAAYDRWLVTQNKPQKYGTQYSMVDGRYQLSEVDPTTTDEERLAWDVPPLHVAKEREGQLPSVEDPMKAFFQEPPLAELAVVGLHVQIKRWLGPSQPVLPRPEPRPLEPGESVPLDSLPPGLRVCRVASRFGAIAASGEVVVTWGTLPLRERTLVMPWVEANEDTPQLEATEVDGRPAIWIGTTPKIGASLVVAVDSATCWCVSGKLDRTTLLQLAERLPKKP